MHSTSALARRVMAVAVLAALVAPASASALGRPLATDLAAAEATAAVKLVRTHAATPLNLAPFYTSNGAWITTDLDHWNSGFLPGSLWYEYQRTGVTSYATAARSRQAKLTPLATYRGTPDIACIMLNTHARAYRLTGDETSRKVALTAAGTFASRYSPKIGMFRAHGTGTSFRTIVDQLMNAELLFWGARNGGDPAWRTMAATNVVRTAKDLQRPDGSTYHYATYNMTTGALLTRGTLAGFSDDSTWSRGQAWFIYGMGVGYRETGDARLLVAARNAVDYWERNVPADAIPYWDFDDPAIPGAPRDTSAAAITASGLLELATLDPDPARRAQYTGLAERTLTSLSSSAYLESSVETASVLGHGTYSHTKGLSDSGLIWGDYFFREALMRLGTRVHRVDGTDRYSVAVRSSQLRFASSEVVVLASGEQYADGLSASSLAGLYRAPILVTRAHAVPATVLAELSRLGARRVIVVGGAGSVGTEVVSAIEGLPGVTVERIGGADRYEVAAHVAERVLADPAASGRVFVARGDIFPDALAVSPLAWSTRSPVLLARPTGLPASARLLLARSSVTTVTVVGGEGSVTPLTASAIEAITGSAPRRVAGRDRYETASALADWAVAGGLASGDAVGITSGLNFPDALTGGAAMGSVDGVMLLTAPKALAPTARGWLHTYLSQRGELTIYGGNVSVSEPVETAIDQVVTFGR